MSGIIRDRYVLFSLASVCVLVMMCTVGSFNTDGATGNGVTEATGVISDPSPSQNGTVFMLTDLGGNEVRCFFRSALPDMPVLCRLIGSMSADGKMFFVDRVIVIGEW